MCESQDYGMDCYEISMETVWNRDNMIQKACPKKQEGNHL